MTKLNLNEIKLVDFPKDQYYRESFDKKQVFIHHTVSGIGVDGDLQHWIGTKPRIATCIIIDRKGDIYQCFGSKYWGHHLGIKVKVFKDNEITLKLNEKNRVINNVLLNKHSVGIELDSWGWLEEKNGKYYSYTGKEVNDVQIYDKPFRGHTVYEKYTCEQLESLEKLLMYWNGKYDIPLCYNEDMWDLSKNALNGYGGIWTHVSVRPDKSDCHPQPELIAMLKNLT